VKNILKCKDEPVQPESLPWEFIKSGVSETFLSSEYNKSKCGEFTSPCMENCTHLCGICRDRDHIVQNIIHDENKHDIKNQNTPGICESGKSDPSTYKILFTFSKTGPGVFYPHLTVIEIFSMGFLRAGIPVQYTAGFNPLPRLEVAAPLAMGISACNEVAAIETDDFFDCQAFREQMNTKLPSGLCINNAMNICIPRGAKKYSLSSLLWGSVYNNGADDGEDTVQFCDEKNYRQSRTVPEGSVYGLTRRSVLCHKPDKPETPEPYFEVFRSLYS
jgi:hypothetical protein